MTAFPISVTSHVPRRPHDAHGPHARLAHALRTVPTATVPAVILAAMVLAASVAEAVDAWEAW